MTVSGSILPKPLRMAGDMADRHIQPVSEVAAVLEVADLRGVFVRAESSRCLQFSSTTPEARLIVGVGD